VGPPTCGMRSPKAPRRDIGEVRVDPLAVLGIVPFAPLPYWGWGDVPDQYRRLWDGDDGESDPPEDPRLSDLPPLRPWWGRRDR